MKKFRTHYDNLKVSRDAPEYIIRAAYKTLIKKYHPDKNPGDSRAARILVIINNSYEVLSDPEKRREHDDWIARAEAEQNYNERRSQHSADGNNQDSHSMPDDVNDEGGLASNQPDSNKLTFLKLVFISAVSYFFSKYLGVILGLTAGLSLLAWYKVGAGLKGKKALTAKLLAVSVVLVVGVAAFFAVIATTDNPISPSPMQTNKNQQDQSIRNTIVTSQSNKALKGSNPTGLNLIKPKWLVLSDDSDRNLMTSIGLFSIIEDDEYRMTILLNEKPVVLKDIDLFDRIHLGSAVDFGGSVVLLFFNGTGGNCRECSVNYAVAFDANGVMQSAIEIPEGFESNAVWQYIEGSYVSEPIPIEGKLYKAIIKSSGVSLIARQLHKNDKAPKELCSALFSYASICADISTSGCAKINESSANELMDLPSRKEPNRSVGSQVVTSWFIAGENDPRVNFLEFKNICRSYCDDGNTSISERAFSTQVCNVN